MSAPLSGLRVVECGVAIAGPLCARYLGHLGADVYKVESRTGGMLSVQSGPAWAQGYGPAAADLTAGANLFNAQKQSVGIDLKHPEGRRAFQQLVAASDVFVCNLSLPAIRSLGLDWESLKAVNGRLIHVAMPGFGSEGPYSSYRSWGPNLSSLSGYDGLTGDPDRPPVMTPVPLPDYLSAYHATVAVLAALRQRDQTGRGQRVDLAQFSATTAGLGPQMAAASLGHAITRDGNRREGCVPADVFPCRGEDRWVAITVDGDDDWRRFCEAAGRADWAADPRFAATAGRLAHRGELEASVAEWTRAQTPWEVASRLQAAGVAAAPVQDHWDHAGDQHLQARGYWKVVTHARLGVDVIPAVPLRPSRTPLVYETASPPFGWHTREALAGVGAVTPDDADRMLAEGSLSPPLGCDPAFDLGGRPWLRWGMPMLRLPAADEPPAADAPVPTRSAAPATGPAPLAGMRILDLSDEVGAYGGRLLALLGADVTRVEPPGGTPLRRFGVTKDGVSLYHEYVDAGKSSVELSLEDEAGPAEFRRLVAEADGVYESCRPGYLDSLGVGPRDLLREHPGLCWVSVTHFGQDGPYRDWRADDLSLWALSGMLQLTGYPDRRPLMPGGMMSYAIAGVHGAIAMLVALQARDRDGAGQYVDVSAHEALVSTAQGGTSMLTLLDDLVPRRRTGDRSLASVPYGFYQCADRLVSILALFPDHWDALAQWIAEKTGRKEALEERFRGGSTGRNAYAAEVTDLVTALTMTMDAQEFCRGAQARGVPAAPVNSLTDALEDPHLDATGYWRAMDHPVLGRVAWPGPPFRLELSAAPAPQRAPQPGERQAPGG